ncbi:MAG: PAS domain S-box protein [Melioribacteraceae bacterium]
MATKHQNNLKVKFTNELFNYLFQFHPLPILVYELKSLAVKNINKAAVQKYGYSKSNFLKLKLTDLSLPDSLRKPSQKISTKNLQKHRTKYGKVIDVQITKSKIVYEGLVCELMIVQDVTEHINLENQLIKAESELRTTLYSIGDGVITTDNKGRIMMMNPVAEKLTGWKEKEAKGKKLEFVFNIVNEFTRKKVVNPVKKVLQKGIVIGLANHTVLISKDKTERPILDCGAPIKDKSGKIAGVVLVFRDQTKEREAQRKIEAAKVFAESIIATVREPLIVLDSQMNVIKANRAFYNIFKTSEKETIGKSFFKLGNGQWNIPELKLLLENILPSNTSFENFEVQHNFPKIGFKTMLLNARRVYSESNKTELVLLALEDITERKKAEENIKKLNRIYSMLYEANEAIVRNREKEKLLKLITRIAVDKGGFSLAWVSMIDVESNELIIVADYGMNEDYRNKINTDLNIIYHDKCPIRKVLKTGKCYVSNNILKDKKMSLCYDAASEYGFKSFAAFPIKTFGNNVGTFNLYSTEENFFDKEEIELLEQLSMDISFALEYIESENERKKVEEILKQNEEKYYTLIESSDDAIYLVDRDCRYLHMNKRYLMRLGLKLEDVIGKSYSEFHTPDGSKDFEEKVKKVCETGLSITYEYQSFRDGRYFIRTLSPVKDAVTNEVNAVVIISKDITHLKEIEKALRESEEKFRKLAESTNTAIFIYKKSKFVYANRATEKLSGYSEQELLQMNFWDVVHPDFRDMIKQLGLGRLSGKEVPSQYDFKIITKDNQEKWVTFTSTVIDYKGETAAIGTAFDITDRKIAEEKLRESEERFRNIYESLTIGVYRTTPDGKLLMANPAFLSMLGYESLEEAQAKIVMEEVYAEKGTRDLFLKIIMEEGIVYGFEQKWKRADGKIIYIRENARAYKNIDGSVAYFEGTTEDITIKN